MSKKQHIPNDERSFQCARYRHGHSRPDCEDEHGHEPESSDSHPHTTLLTDGGISSQPGDGSHSQQDCFRDCWAYTLSPGFATGVRADLDTGFVPARTTFFAKEAPQHQQEWYDTLWLIHQGIDGWSECPIDEVERGHRLNRAHRGKYLVCDTILQQLEVPRHVREDVISRVMTTDCRGFSRHHGGVKGAAIGFALLSLVETEEELASSAYWPTVKAICSSIGIDADALASYVFRTYAPTAEAN